MTEPTYLETDSEPRLRLALAWTEAAYHESKRLKG